MKLSNFGKQGNSPKKRKTRSRYKIRWELMGLARPGENEPVTPMETIRREVSLLAIQGFEERAHASSAESKVKGRGLNHNLSGNRVRPRGATE